MNDTEKKPRALEVLDSDGSLVFSIEANGEIYLKGEKIGESKEVADSFLNLGQVGTAFITCEKTKRLYSAQ